MFRIATHADLDSDVEVVMLIWMGSQQCPLTGMFDLRIQCKHRHHYLTTLCTRRCIIRTPSIGLRGLG